jgi:hypothetical protein
MLFRMTYRGQDHGRSPDKEEWVRILLWDDRFLIAALAVAGLAGATLGPAVGPVGWYMVGFGGLFALWQIRWADRLGLSGLSRRESKASSTLEEEERRARSHGSQPNAERIARALAEDVDAERRGRQIRSTLALATAMLGFGMALTHS